MSLSIFYNSDCGVDQLTMTAVVVVASAAIIAFAFFCCGKEEVPKPGGVSSVTFSNSVTLTRAGTQTRKKFTTIRFRKE